MAHTVPKQSRKSKGVFALIRLSELEGIFARCIAQEAIVVKALESFFSVVGTRKREDCDSAPGGELADHLQIAGRKKAGQVVADLLDAVLMEITVISETKKVELQRLGLDHFLICEVIDENFGEVRLTGERAKGGEFGAHEGDPLEAPWVLVREGFEELWVVAESVACLRRT
jgi:hypothetical protein